MKIKSIEVVSIQCPSATSLSESLTYAGRSGQFFLDMTLGIRMKPNYRICKLSGQRILSINSQEVKKLSHSSSQTIQQREILSTQPKLTTPPKGRRISMFSRLGTLFLASFLFITLFSSVIGSFTDGVSTPVVLSWQLLFLADHLSMIEKQF